MDVSLQVLIGYLLNLLLGLFIVFKERKNIKSTWLWLMILLYLPFVGFILYMFFGLNYRKRKTFDEKMMLDEQEKRLIEHQKKYIALSNSDSLNADQKDLINLCLATSDSAFTDYNDIKFYFDGKDKFKDLFEDIKNAKEYIYIEYYIFKTDELGRELISLLNQKLKEGVEVRILVDAVGSRNIRKRHFIEFKRLGGEVDSFFPLFFSKFTTRFNYRNHRKIVVIDGKIAYSGGFNVGNEYINNDKKFGFWRDTHFRLEGDIVEEYLRRFNFDYRFATKIKTKGEFYKNHDIKTLSRMQLVTSGPDSMYENIRNIYLKMISTAKTRLWIQSPYFVPDESIFEAVRIAALSGVDVRIMIPDKPDHFFVYWATQSYVGQLLEDGVKVYEYGKGFLHAKQVIKDDDICTVGTANFDIRSFSLNFEANLIFYDKDTNALLSEQFLRDMEESKELTLDRYNQRSRVAKIKESITRLFSPML